MALAILAVSQPVATQGPDAEMAVSALGRIEPEHGIIRIAAPSTPDAVSGAVLAELRVDTGDDVVAGQVLGVIDTAALVASRVTEAEASLQLAERNSEASAALADEACIRADVDAREAERLASLKEQGLAAEEETERAQGDAQAGAATCIAARQAARVAEANIEVAQAALASARAAAERTVIRAPSDGRILEILARPGELLGENGLAELGRVARMYAIAEVYETDVGRVRLGESATADSAALATTLTGRVTRIRPKIQNQDELGTDPAARKDARVVEVEILLDDPAAVRDLTNLQVEIVIGAR